ncbi:MAG: peptide chain release factor N(5)-glutamine methyltransferase [Oscillospiraceae bacterium]|nr:peptide chain release factor N(5)-glutamine methyltransferase [Oscillospiraceae bacterium]
MIRDYNEFYLDARRRLKAAGVEAAGLEARLLLAFAADKSPEEFLRDIRMYPDEAFSRRAEDLVRRRLAGEPAAYLTGSWSFYGLDLEINPNVLIPRADSELAVDAALSCLADAAEPRVLDLCTGSGCIGIAIAARVPACRVILADLDRRALLLAKRNAMLNHVSGRVLCAEADVHEGPSPRLGEFTLIVCNPPYIPTRELETLDPSVRDYEPRLALDGGEDGLDFYRSIFARWIRIIRPGGWLVLECGEGQSMALRRLSEECGVIPTDTLLDGHGTERTLVFRKPGPQDPD